MGNHGGACLAVRAVPLVIWASGQRSAGPIWQGDRQRFLWRSRRRWPLPRLRPTLVFNVNGKGEGGIRIFVRVLLINDDVNIFGHWGVALNRGTGQGVVLPYRKASERHTGTAKLPRLGDVVTSHQEKAGFTSCCRKARLRQADVVRIPRSGVLFYFLM